MFNMNKVTHINFPRFLNTINLYSTENAGRIVIPNRIHRGPTDILKALSSTVKRDPTAAHFKYHDDSFLIPSSNTGKRIFAMAQEAGRKAAMFIRQEQAKLFQHNIADPPIEAYKPRPVYDEKSEVNEEILLNLIHNARLSDAVIVYNILKEKSKLSEKCIQSMLELLCYYNEEEPVSEELIEERWFQQSAQTRDRQRNTWKDHSLADQIFNSLETKTPAAYCAIIRGMAKFFQVDRAWAMYQETLEKRIPIDTDTYNSLIRVANFLKESADLRWNLISELLTNMKNQGLRPNVLTVNSVLEAISLLGVPRLSQDYCLKALAEFKSLNLEPSLAGWYHVLNTFCKERGPISSILVDIMNHISGKEFAIVDPKDTFFFVTAMDICHNHLNDVELARRVDDLLHTGENYNLIGDSYKESIYYRHYFMLICSTEPLEVFMEFYDKLVPNIYTPEPSVMFEILKAIDLNGSVELLPRIWSHMVMFDHINRANIVTLLLNIMVKYPAESLTDDNTLSEKFSEIAWAVWEKVEGQDESRTKQITWTGDLLGNILLLVLRNKEFDKATTVLEKLNSGVGTGIPSIEPLQIYLDLCITNKTPSRAIMCIQYCADNAFSETVSMAKYLKEQMTLDETQLERLENIVGYEALK